MSQGTSTLTPMNRDWESWLATASRPASATEEQERDRTEREIRAAIAAAADIRDWVRVYAKGSYANGTNVRRNADVDVAVEWNRTAIVDTWGETAGLGPAELGYTPTSEEMTASRFRQRVEDALVTALGSSRVDSTGDKAINLRASTGTLDADVVPCFELHRYDHARDFVVGHRLFPKSGGYVDNFPRQNYDNGVAKNSATRRRYKEIVRCTKRLVGELHDKGIIRQDYPGYLIESLLYNVPNDRFGHIRRYDDMQQVFAYLWNGLQNSDQYNAWTEPNELIMLFRGHTNRIPRNALAMIDAAWDMIGVA